MFQRELDAFVPDRVFDTHFEIWDAHASMDGSVGVEHCRPEPPQGPGGNALAHADGAGEAEDDHVRRQSRPRSPPGTLERQARPSR